MSARAEGRTGTVRAGAGYIQCPFLIRPTLAGRH